jgi:hypothetical protein
MAKEEIEMKENGKFLVLYLTDWQIKMVKDFLGADCHRWKVPIGDQPSVRYGMRFARNPDVKRMYLTDWQKREIADIAGESCDFVELEKDLVHTLYGMPPDRD